MNYRRWQFFLPCLLGSVLSSCSQTSGIPDQAVADYIKRLIPAFLEIKNVTTERVSPSDVSQGFNFKVTAAPAEPLFVSASFQDVQNELIADGLKPASAPSILGAQYNFRGLDQLQYIRQVNAPSDPITIYGYVTARKIVDKIEYSGLSFSSGFEGIGKPKGSFPPGTLIVGSAAYKSRLNSLIESQQRELTEQRATEEQKKAALEKRKAELIEGTSPGMRYRGTWSLNSSSRIISSSSRISRWTAES